MNAPNKIYIQAQDGKTITTNRVFETDIEYIRKDALLEWADSWLAFKRSGIVLDDGFSYAMEELKKKLNNM